MKLIKISLVVLSFLMPTVFAATYDQNTLLPHYGKTAWDKKKNTAIEFSDSDSNYRIYKPDVSQTAEGGLLVTAKVNHIRGFGGDDQCILKLTYDKNGALVSSSADITLGDKSVSTGLIQAVGDAAGKSKEAATAAAVAKKLTDQIAVWGEKGGRAHFPNVLEHIQNRISTGVKP